METFGRTLNIPFELFGTLMLFAMLWLLFYQLNYQDKIQESKTRRILLIIGMALYRPLLCIPLPGLLRILLPFAMIAVLAWLAGGKKRSVWITAVYYCGVTVSIDTIATAMVLGLTSYRGSLAFSDKELYFYGGISIYIVLFLAALIYYLIMRAVPRDAIDRIPLPVWLIPLIIQPAGTVALYAPMDSLLTQLEAGYNNFLFLGLFLIALTILNLVIFFFFVKLISGYNARLLAGEINKTPPLYSPHSGLSPEFIEKYGLSARQIEITEALLKGKPDKEIAVLLNIASSTVRVHLKTIYQKTGALGRYALMSLVGMGVNNADREQESGISNTALRADAHSAAQNESDRRFRASNFLVILLCLSGAAFCINLFRLDLFGSFDNKNEEPVGTVIITNDIVRRRMANRVFWERLTVDSHVYSGDQIRTADFSNVTLHIENNSIDLNEKTLIRIQRSPGGEDSIQIELAEGNLVLSTVAGGGNLVLSIAGRQVETAPGTILSASTGKDGAVMQVSEGMATLTGDGQRREIASGTMIALDTKGAERTVQEAPVPAHRSNAMPAGSQVPVEPVIELPQAPQPQTGPQVSGPQVPPPPPPLLAAPLNLQPPEGHRIGIGQLKESNSIVFTWSAVPDADAYIFTLYKATVGGPATSGGPATADSRRQIIRVPPVNRRNWTLENLETLGEGTFIWQVEAVNVSAGTIERQGRIAENSFVIDIPRSGMVQIESNEQ